MTEYGNPKAKATREKSDIDKRVNGDLNQIREERQVTPEEIGTTKLGAGSVVGTKLADGTVTHSKISDTHPMSGTGRASCISGICLNWFRWPKTAREPAAIIRVLCTASSTP